MTGNQNKQKREKNLNGRWSKSQHERFIKGYQKFGKNWVEVQAVVKTRSLTQVRSHAQKMFLNMEQNGLNNSDFEDSDQISYRESSVSQDQSNSSGLFNRKIKRTTKSRRAKMNENQSMVVQAQTKLVAQKHQRIDEESTHFAGTNLPQKQALINYVYKCPKPSHFLLCLTQQRDFFNNGGNFLDLCIQQNTENTNRTF